MVLVTLNKNYSDLYDLYIGHVPDGTVLLGTVRWNRLHGALAFDKHSGSYYLLTYQRQYTLPQIETAQAHGYDAVFDSNMTIADNPHKPGTLAYQAWDLGYKQSIENDREIKDAIDNDDWNYDLGCRESAITEIEFSVDWNKEE